MWKQELSSGSKDRNMLIITLLDSQILLYYQEEILYSSKPIKDQEGIYYKTPNSLIFMHPAAIHLQLHNICAAGTINT